MDSGSDVVAERRERAIQPTVGETIEDFLDTKRELASVGSMASAMRKHLVPTIGDQRMAEVRRREIIRLLERLAQDHPRQAGLILTYLKQMFAWAEDREIIDASPVASLKASKIGVGLTPSTRARVLTDAEIKALWTIKQPPSGVQTITLLALQMILLTGQRPGEVSGMRWDEITGNTWIIPPERRGKTQDAQAVPLTDTAWQILNRAKGTSAYVFSARNEQPIGATAIARAVRRYGEYLGSDTPLWRPHDLRRTMRTGLATVGIPEHVAEVTIGHVRRGIAAVYDQHRYDKEKRQAIEAWERRLEKIASRGYIKNDVAGL